jgi:hypothetical protein
MIAEEILIRKVNALPPGKIDEVIDFVDFLVSREATAWRAERTASIAEFAAQFGGTEFDIDEDLEAAAVDDLLAIEGAPR